ncbi:GumC family protein [Jiella marina]|uniref:GumC family protein n=1 Tax=Jiella sp. LLJ827 TaxID=2917712 RepID=UPI002100F698|nr:GumC family protein [Jiella sp. LLJ827]MCQ0990298.1 GumC family protein [Jiella sp. LLJ827]
MFADPSSSGGARRIPTQNDTAARQNSGASGLGALVDPLFLISEIWAAKRMIVLATLLGFAVATLLALSTPKKYTAITEVLVDPRDIKVVQNEVTPNGLPSDATLALIESQIAVIYSNDVLTRVIEQADLTEDSEFNGEAESFFAPVLAPIQSVLNSEDDEASRETQRLFLLRALREALHVSRDPKSFVINVAIESRDPDKSAKLANLVADSFIEELAEVQSETARRASNALSSRLAELRQSVVEAERAVEDYKSQNRLVGVGGRLVDDDYIVRINDQLARSRGETTSLRVRAEQMKNASVDDVVEGSFPEELRSEALTRLRSTYSDLAQQRAVLAATLGPRHPRRIGIEEALSSTRQAIRQELARIVSGAQIELSRAEETERQLAGQVSELKDKQLETSGSFVKLRELEREVDASRAVYEAFLLRARETGEQERMNTANVRIISAATQPLDPSSASRKILVLAGGLIGFLGGVGVAAGLAILKVIRQSMRRPRPATVIAPAMTLDHSAADEVYARDYTQPAGHSRSEADRGFDHSLEMRPSVHDAPASMRSGSAPADDIESKPSENAGEPVQSSAAPSASAAQALSLEAALRRRRAELDRTPARTAPAVAVAEAEPPIAAPRPAIEAPSSTEPPVGDLLPRDALRARLRAIAETAAVDTAGRPMSPLHDEELARLQRDILAVKRNIAEARSRRPE